MRFFTDEDGVRCYYRFLHKPIHEVIGIDGKVWCCYVAYGAGFREKSDLDLDDDPNWHLTGTGETKQEALYSAIDEHNEMERTRG